MGDTGVLDAFEKAVMILMIVFERKTFDVMTPQPKGGTDIQLKKGSATKMIELKGTSSSSVSALDVSKALLQLVEASDNISIDDFYIYLAPKGNLNRKRFDALLASSEKAKAIEYIIDNYKKRYGEVSDFEAKYDHIVSKLVVKDFGMKKKEVLDTTKDNVEGAIVKLGYSKSFAERIYLNVSHYLDIFNYDGVTGISSDFIDKAIEELKIVDRASSLSKLNEFKAAKGFDAVSLHDFKKINFRKEYKNIMATNFEPVDQEMVDYFLWIKRGINENK